MFALKCNSLAVTRPAPVTARRKISPAMSGSGSAVRSRGSNNRKEDAMSYVDGFVIAVPKANIEAYKKMAQLGGEVWMEYGALSYVECLADDVPYGELTSFPRAVQATDDETVVFSWVVYKDKASRDEIMAKVMADPRLQKDMKDMPFDAKRMIFGGFAPFLER
jgi:uncharacterized protein YbaA (DUF1428 family)